KIAVASAGSDLRVLPPDPGTDGCAAVKLGMTAGAGDRYSLQFGPESVIKNSGDSFFRARNPTEEGVCRTLIPCGALPYPICGETCDGGSCAAVEGPVVGQGCGCVPWRKTCGDTCTFACTKTEDCQAKTPSCVFAAAGTCPAGQVCSAAIAGGYSCPPG